MPRLADVGLAPEFVAELASVSPPVVTVESLFIRDRQEIASQCRVTTEVIHVFNAPCVYLGHPLTHTTLLQELDQALRTIASTLAAPLDKVSKCCST